MLHTISTSIHSLINIEFISSGDAVLFWQDGVIIALQKKLILDKILEKTKNCYALDSDLIARGLTQFVDKRIEVINMQQAVELTVKHSPQVNWSK